jgi:hypothetical protein
LDFVAIWLIKICARNTTKRKMPQGPSLGAKNGNSLPKRGRFNFFM